MEVSYAYLKISNISQSSLVWHVNDDREQLGLASPLSSADRTCQIAMLEKLGAAFTFWLSSY